MHLLPPLKATQLQRLAQATGIKSSGPKPVLAARLATELGKVRPGENGQRLSVLSIDMGIRNLAFAHLVVPPLSSSSSSSSSPSLDELEKGNNTGYTDTSKGKDKKIYLNAWHRLPITEASLREFSQSLSPSSPKQAKEETEIEKDEENKEEPFTPETYAPHAYTLLTTLLARYRPTHVLIERQRFRSGGASAVQEWSLRVGVFEGMLHAVLFTLGRQQQQLLQQGEKKKPVPPVVVGIEPRRVGRYWEQVRGLALPSVEQGEEGKKKKRSSKEGKKAKIALVGEWLEAASADASADASSGDISSLSSSSSAGRTSAASWSGLGAGISTSTSTPTSTPTANNTTITTPQITPSPTLQPTITAYLARWRGTRPQTRKKRQKQKPRPVSEMADGRGGDTDRDVDREGDADADADVEIEGGIERGNEIEIGKLDDLADCLVQGVTWLEWRAMRERVVFGGEIPGV